MKIFVLGEEPATIPEVYELGWGFSKFVKKIARKVKKVAKRVGKAAAKATGIATAFLTGGWAAAAQYTSPSVQYSNPQSNYYPQLYSQGYRPNYLTQSRQPSQSNQFQNLLPLLAVGAGALLLFKKK